MRDKSQLKLRIAFSTIGIVMLLVVLYYFIKNDLTKDYPFYLSAGSICLAIIICCIAYGSIYSDIQLLSTTKLKVIFRGFNIIQTVTVGLIFLIATLIGIIFLPHVLIASLGLSCVMFTITHGIRFIIFDYSARTVEGLIEERIMNFDKLQIISANEIAIEVKALDSGHTTVLSRETCDYDNWIKIITNCSKMND